MFPITLTYLEELHPHKQAVTVYRALTRIKGSARCLERSGPGDSVHGGESYKTSVAEPPVF